MPFLLKPAHYPEGKEASEELQNRPADGPVLVWLESSVSWERPYPFSNIEGETVVIHLPQGREISR